MPQFIVVDTRIILPVGVQLFHSLSRKQVREAPEYKRNAFYKASILIIC
jgi:hypothetical protein